MDSPRKRAPINIEASSKVISYYASTATFPICTSRFLPPNKKQRLLPTLKNGILSQKSTALPTLLDHLKVYSNQDILICGNCREMFSDLQDLLYHKKTYCKLRFTCKCVNYDHNDKDENSSTCLLCVQCKDAFQNAWDLMVHVQAAHMVNIYELGAPSLNTCSSAPLPSRDNHTPERDVPTISKENDPIKKSESNILKNVRDDIVEAIGAITYHNKNRLDDCINDEYGQTLPTTKTCIMHAVGVVSIPAPEKCSTSPCFAAVAPNSEDGDIWKAQTAISTSFERKAYEL